MKDPEVRSKVYADVAAYINWEVQVLESKMFPEKWYNAPFVEGTLRHNRRGTYFAEGFGGIFAGIKGDRKARKEVHRFQRNYASTFICERCVAMLSVFCLWFECVARNILSTNTPPK
jgi:hypothetical protein